MSALKELPKSLASSYEQGVRFCPKCSDSYHSGDYCPKDGTRLRIGSRPEASTEANEDPMIGQVMADRFRIVRSLGRGGMGSVYEAEHLYIHKRVALKVLNSDIVSSQEVLSRFQREALAASTIGHENIVRIDDFGQLEGGQVYLTMEYLEGESLGDAIRTRVLSISESLNICAQICDGLSAAHAKGIIHRDIKADNIFLREKSQRVVILDFGIAKVSGGGAGANNLTKTGAIFGTPYYMSPEQALGKGIDHRADIYSVGVILYEMLSGTVPFVSDSFMGVITQHLSEEPEALASRVPERQIPREVEAIVGRAMAKDPANRFADMSDFARAVRALSDPMDGRSDGAWHAVAASGEALSASVDPASAHTLLATSGEQHPEDGGRITATAGEILQPDDLPAARSSRWPVGVALFVLCGGLVGYFSLDHDQAPQRVAGGTTDTPGSKSVPSGGTHSESPLTSRPKPISNTRARPEVKKGVRRLAKASRAAKRARPALSLERRVTLITRPPGAAIFRGGKRIGRTPRVLTLAKGHHYQLTLTRNGYRPRKLTIGPRSANRKVVRLRRLASQRTRIPPPASGRRTQADQQRPSASGAEIRPLGTTGAIDEPGGGYRTRPDHGDHEPQPDRSRVIVPPVGSDHDHD